MNGQTKTIAEINAKLAAGEAIVMTAMELKARVRGGEKLFVADVDVVTTATRGVMSGTAAMLSLPIGVENTKPEEVFINGVPCLPQFRTRDCFTPGLINGTEESMENHGNYGGGHVLRELVERKPVEIFYKIGGKSVCTTATIDDFPFARLYTTRNSFQNYMGFTNVKNAESYRRNPTSIFSCRPIPPLKGMTSIGSGEMNPGENDHSRQIIRPGIRVLVNGTIGLIAGYGTRASAEQICLATVADMKDMDPQYMGGFRTSYGVEITNSLAVAFPIINQVVLDNIMECRDEKIRHKIGDLSDRGKILTIPYSDLWHEAPLEVQFDPERCICCSYQCEAEYYCPMNAISWKDKTIDQTLCVACGACTGNCQGGAFMGKGWSPRRGLGDVHIFDQDIPIIFRQSNRLRSERLARVLKERLLDRSMYLVDTDTECKLWN